MNVLEFYRDLGFELRMVNAGEWMGPCPDCGGKDRFRIWPAEGTDNKGKYWCRVCETTGDAIQFLRDFRDMTYSEACKTLGRDPGTAPRRMNPTPVERQPAAFEPKVWDNPPALWIEKGLALVTEAHEALLRTPAALDYLDGRGVPLEAVTRHQLGLNLGERGRDSFRPYETWGLPEQLKEDGKPRRLWMPRGLVIPCFRGGQLIRIRFRRRASDMRPGDQKYVVLPGSSHAPFLTRETARAWGVVEAELDAISIGHAAGDLIPGGFGGMGMGNLSLKPDVLAHGLLLKSDRILNALDFEPSDAPDEESRRKEADKAKHRTFWTRTYGQARRWPVPQGKDPGEAFALGVDLREWIAAGLPQAWFGAPAVSQPDSATVGPFLVAGSAGGAGPESLERAPGRRAADDEMGVDGVCPVPAPQPAPKPQSPAIPPSAQLRALILSQPLALVLSGVTPGRVLGVEGKDPAASQALALAREPEAAAWLAAHIKTNGDPVTVAATDFQTKPKGGRR